MTSNFIVEMQPKTLQKIIFGYILAFCAILPLGSLAYYLNEQYLIFTSIAFTSIAYIGFLLFLIAFLKKDINYKNKFIYLIAVGIIILSSISAVFAVDKELSLYGNTGRYEGLYAIIAYFGLFFAGSILYNKKYIKKVFDMLIFIGIIQCVIGILQHIPALENIIPSYYSRFYILSDAFIANGLTGSPFFLASFISILMGISLSGAIYDKSKIRKYVYGFASILFAITALFTSIIPALIGICVPIITICIIELIRFIKGYGNSLIKLAIIILLIAIGIITVLLTEGIKLQDKTIMYQDSFYRLWITGPDSVKDETFIYEHTWKEGLSLIKDHPLIGVGPDCIVKGLYNTTTTTSLSAGSIDRPYNQYLYIAISRGIPVLLLYLGLLFFSLKKGLKGVKSYFENKSSWIDIAITVAIIAYITQAFFNMSSITIAPYFWLLLGLVWRKQTAE